MSAFDGVVPIVNAAGFRTIVPYLRGYGPTRFLSPDTPRSGEQAALGMDLLELLDALQIRQVTLAGFDWGGRAACVVSALWPERSRGLVTCTGYQIQDIANSDKPADPEQERRFWYQFYFNTERGRKGLTQMRSEIGKLLWKLWSPNWAFDEETYRRTAKSFDNPDFVDVVIHSYSHRMSNRIQLRPPFASNRDPIKSGRSGLIHVVHRRAPRPTPRVSSRWRRRPWEVPVHPHG